MVAGRRTGGGGVTGLTIDLAGAGVGAGGGTVGAGADTGGAGVGAGAGAGGGLSTGTDGTGLTTGGSRGRDAPSSSSQWMTSCGVPSLSVQ